MKPDKLTFIQRFPDDIEQLRVEYESSKISENFIKITWIGENYIFVERNNVDWLIERLNEIRDVDLCDEAK